MTDEVEARTFALKIQARVYGAAVETLTKEQDALVECARELSRAGVPLRAIAREITEGGVDIHYSTLSRWLNAPTEEETHAA